MKEGGLVKKEIVKVEKTIWNDFRGWRREICDHKYLILMAVAFYIIAAIIYFLSGRYVMRAVGGAKVSDLILDNIPSIDLSFLFTYGFILVLVVLIVYPLFFRVRDLHIVASQLSLLVLIRSFFVILTHMQVPNGAILSNLPDFFSIFIFNNDLFFSGHTAVPFLGFLLFRKEPLGKFFLIMTFVLAATVLAMHVHYSIDVFAAIFITYGSYKIGKFIINKVKD